MDEVFSIQVSKILWTHYACSHMSSCSLIQTKQYIKIFMVKQELFLACLMGHWVVLVNWKLAEETQNQKIGWKIAEKTARFILA